MLIFPEVLQILALEFRYFSRKEAYEDIPYQDVACSFIDYDCTTDAPQFPPLDDE